MTTLNTILKEHPEWGDLPVGIYTESGEIDFIDFADNTRGAVYDSEWWDDSIVKSEDYDENGEYTGEKFWILVFAPN